MKRFYASLFLIFSLMGCLKRPILDSQPNSTVIKPKIEAPVIKAPIEARKPNTRQEAHAFVKDETKKAKDKNPANEGHRALIAEMEKSPEILATDILRLSYIRIGNGGLNDFKLVNSQLKGKKPLEVIEEISDALQKYINNYKIRIWHTLFNKKRKRENKFDKFSPIEIIYTLSQNFRSRPYEKFVQEHPELQGKYASLNGDKNTKIWLEIFYSPRSDKISVIANSEKYLINIEDDSKPPKILITTFYSFFYLSSDTVEFFASYSLDGKVKKWKLKDTIFDD